MAKKDRNFVYIISLTLVGTLVSTVLYQQKRNKSGDVMNEASYVADQLKEKSIIGEDTINREIEVMLRENKNRKEFDMVRILRPDENPVPETSSSWLSSWWK